MGNATHATDQILIPATPFDADCAAIDLTTTMTPVPVVHPDVPTVDETSMRRG